jgi:hypothetical protein
MSNFLIFAYNHVIFIDFTNLHYYFLLETSLTIIGLSGSAFRHNVEMPVV